MTVALGIWHLSVPRLFAMDRAIGTDGASGPALGRIRLGRWHYERRRADAVGLTWVMSNAASFVLVSIGVIDVAWAFGDRTISIGLGAWWIATWWLLRAVSQFALGRRGLDLAVAAAFLSLTTVHVVIAMAA